MGDSICWSKNRVIITTINKFDLIVSFNEMVQILVCLGDERSTFSDQCGICNECKKLLFFIEKLQKLDLEVRQKPKTFIKYITFNKTHSKLEVYYQKTYASFEETKKDKVNFFSFKFLCVYSKSK